MTPTLSPLARLTGMIASTANWNLSATSDRAGIDRAGGAFVAAEI